MHNTEIERSALSQSLREHLDRFESRCAEYQEQQRQFTEVIRETERLRQTAAALESEAEEANAGWKKLAMMLKSDQRKINAEIERSVSLKQQAEGLIRTAEVREELHRTMAVPLAQARFDLAGSARALNGSYRAERLRILLEMPGMKEALTEIYAITRFELKTSIDGVDSGRFQTTESITRACDAAFIEALGIHRNTAAPDLVFIPEPVAGEVVASSLMALKRFKDAGGEIPLQAVMPGANPSQPIPGLRRA